MIVERERKTTAISQKDSQCRYEPDVTLTFKVGLEGNCQYRDYAPYEQF